MPLELKAGPYADEHFAPMAELFASHFDPKDRLLTARYTKWLYEENPFGRGISIRVTEGDQWVAFVAMVPVQLGAACGQTKAYYAVNALVHPSYQGQQLFGRMIAEAKQIAALEGAPLMGHPNALAYKPWQRVQVPFHDELRPSLAIPLMPTSLRAERVTHRQQLADVAPVLSRVVLGSDSWRVSVTPEYLDWRYLQQPGRTYVLQLLSSGSSPAGVQATRKLRPGAHLLVDQVVLPQHEAAAHSRLPLATVCFWPESVTSTYSRRLIRLPMRKRLRVFFTPAVSAAPPGGITQLGLSASDF